MGSSSEAKDVENAATERGEGAVPPNDIVQGSTWQQRGDTFEEWAQDPRPYIPSTDNDTLRPLRPGDAQRCGSAPPLTHHYFNGIDRFFVIQEVTAVSI